jgi:hypothetical protein
MKGLPVLIALTAFAVAPPISPAKAGEPQTTADILPADACQPCNKTVPKLKLLPRDVKELFKGRSGGVDEPTLMRIL